MSKFFRFLDVIFEIATPILFVAYGIVVIFFSNIPIVSDNYILLLSILLIIQGSALIADFIGEHKIKELFNFDIAFGIISIVLGAMFLSNHFDIETICVIWGGFEVIKGAFEIQHIISKLRRREFIALLELACAITEVVFGTLLCIHTKEDIQVHLVVVGIVFIVSAIAQVLNTILEHKKVKK